MALRFHELREWLRLLVVVGSRAYRAMLLTLAAIALVPALWGWQSYVVHSGSMEPTIAVGDVALGRPYVAGEKVAVGRVYTFQDPGTDDEHVMLHRIVERLDDGDYTSAGDANEVTDLTPVTPDHLRTRAVLLVPYVGLPVVWLTTGELTRLGLWLLLTVVAFWLASRTIDGEPPRWSLLRLLRQSGDRRRGGRPVSPTIAMVVALALVGATAQTANAGFSARTRNSGNQWVAGAGLQPYAAAVMRSDPYGFWMLDGRGTSLQDRSGWYSSGYLVGAVTPGVAGALPGNPGSALRFAGGGAVLNPYQSFWWSSYSIETWIRTTSTREGYLAGFESSILGTSGEYERTVLMDAQGRIIHGLWPGWVSSTVTTPRSYNDGAWHHVVVTGRPDGLATSAADIYVDGVLVASGRTPAVENGYGYWRLGEGSAPGYWGTTRLVSYTGDMDAVALYDRVLTAAEVAAHYAAR